MTPSIHERWKRKPYMKTKELIIVSCYCVFVEHTVDKPQRLQ